MRRWVWRILLAALVLTALTGSALAADPVTLDNGIILEQATDGWTVAGSTKTSGRVVIPAQYDGKPVRYIKDKAFKDSKITEVVIPGSVTLVSYNAFENCSSLGTVIFLEEGQKLTIGHRAFFSCGISTLILPRGLTTIEEQAFAGNLKLTEVAIPETVTSVQSAAFSHCRNMVTVYLPPNIPAGSIDKLAFSDTPLKTVHFGGTVAKDAPKLFTNGRLPNGLTSQQNVHLATYDRIIQSPT